MTHLTAPITRPARIPLRAALLLDAAVTGANGAAYLLAAGPLGDLLGLPSALLRGTGVFLLAFAALVLLAGTRAHIARPAVLAIVAVNALWTIDSVVVAVTGTGTPSTVGTVWILLQAAVVAGFAALQLTAMPRTRGR